MNEIPVISRVSVIHCMSNSQSVCPFVSEQRERGKERLNKALPDGSPDENTVLTTESHS